MWKSILVQGSGGVSMLEFVKAKVLIHAVKCINKQVVYFRETINCNHNPKITMLICSLFVGFMFSVHIHSISASYISFTKMLYKHIELQINLLRFILILQLCNWAWMVSIRECCSTFHTPSSNRFFYSAEEKK